MEKKIETNYRQTEASQLTNHGNSYRYQTVRDNDLNISRYKTRSVGQRTGELLLKLLQVRYRNGPRFRLKKQNETLLEICLDFSADRNAAIGMIMSSVCLSVCNDVHCDPTARCRGLKVVPSCS